MRSGQEMLDRGREIVNRLCEAEWGEVRTTHECRFCRVEAPRGHVLTHEDDCPIPEARQWLKDLCAMTPLEQDR